MGCKKQSIKFQGARIRTSAICALFEFLTIIDGDFFSFIDVAGGI